MAQSWIGYVVLFGAGAIAGTINVIAGGGSLLTLPVLIFLGLPATVANGTNRVAIAVQNVGAVWGFHRHRLVDWSWLAVAAAPAVAGAIVGAWLATRIDDETLQRVIAVIMMAVTVWTVWDPLRRRAVSERLRGRTNVSGRVGLAGAFLVVGVYGGFIQAGVGFIILGVTTAAGLDLVRGNALKVLTVLTFTVPALALFAVSGKVVWGMGLALATGNLLGGLLGVRLTVLKGHRWVRRVVLIAVVAFALRLWLSA